MKLLALDIATTTGVAIGSPGGTPICFAKTLGKRTENHQLVFSRALSLTSNLIHEHQPDFLAYEGAVGGDRTSHFLVGIIACITGCAANRGIDSMSCNIGAIRKHFIGKHITSASYPHLKKSQAKAMARKDAKLAVLNRCKMLGWPAMCEDSADACAVWDYALAQMKMKSTVGGMFNE